MMELYNDKLIDLFAKPGTSDDVIFFLSFVTVDSLDFVVAKFSWNLCMGTSQPQINILRELII